MMKYLISYTFLLLLAGMLTTTTSCKKKQFKADGNLEFSLDTLVFDTVFTTVGSTTGQFKVYNRHNKGITIEEIELMGGENSPFSINFDGLQGTFFEDIGIEGGDSLFCFVEVTLSVNGTNLPMVVEDSIRFRTNGTDQYVKLAVWGQDAYFHNYDINSGTWSTDKPHVVYGRAQVAPNQTLTIDAGTKVYLHKNSAIYVYRGTLNVTGTANNKVIFRGDRLESFYDNVPGQWYGIYLDSAYDCSIDHAVIKNATTGIHVESKDPDQPGETTVKVTNTEIKNSASFGMLLYDLPKVEAENVLIYKSGIHALIVLQGAEMKFTHCDLLAYGPGDGSYPAVGMRNYFTAGNGITTVRDITAEFNNCVIYGNDEEQLVMDTLSGAGIDIDFIYRNCLLRTELSASSPLFSGCVFNVPPLFSDISGNDFRFTSPSSGLSNLGNPAYQTAGNTDLLGVPRQNPPDIGVYETP
jgi:hypothetical protein